MAQVGEPVLRRPCVRVAMNAITEPAPKFGSQVYLWELASALAESNGIDLILLVAEGQRNKIPSALRSHAVEVPVRAGRSYSLILQQRRLREALLREKVDVYHVPNTMPLIRHTGLTVITIHDLAELRTSKYGILRVVYRFFVNFVGAQLADCILTVSENSRRDIVQLLHVPPSKVKVIYNGVSEDFRPLERKACKDYLASKYFISADFILAPGGLSKNKNISRVLAATCMLRDRGRQESLVVLGDKSAPEYKRVARDVRRFGLEETAIFPGFVPRQDLPAFYNAASAVLYPTLYEGFGLPVLEAMACGTPVVTSKSSSLPEIAGDAALLVDPRDPAEISKAVERLLVEETTRAELSFRGLVHVRNFSWRKAGEQTLELFRQLTRKRAGSETDGTSARSREAHIREGSRVSAESNPNYVAGSRDTN